MQAVILAATHEQVKNAEGKDVPLVLVDLEGKPQLTVLVEKLSKVSGLRKTIIVTNEVVKPELDNWAVTFPQVGMPVQVLSDGTIKENDRKGAIGDIIFAIKHANIDDDLIVVGGDNWFRYDIAKFVEQSRNYSPAVVVTSYDPKLLHSSRFGLVKMEGNRIKEFFEKPEASDLDKKASCVYFFSASDLRLFNDFADDHPGTLSHFKPGHFIAWLIDHKIPVYGVGMEAQWYDIGEYRHPRLGGPDFFAIRNIVRTKFDSKYSTWEKRALHLVELVSSYAELLDYLGDPDPNLRIVAAIIIGHLDDLIGPNQKAYVIPALCNLLNDDAQNQLDGSFQSDEDTVYFVSATAAESLVRLGYEENVHAVTVKAKKEGFKVKERINIRS